MTNLLSIDFDYFFRNPAGDPSSGDWALYDWGHREAPEFIDGDIWEDRARDFFMNGRALPGTTGEETGFWQRFSISPDAELFYADSHVHALDPRVSTGVDAVWNYDAHHDCGYRRTRATHRRWTCEDWLLAYVRMGATAHVRYPRWGAGWRMGAEKRPQAKIDRAVDDGSTPDVVFDRVYVCRSGAWVPSWLDDAFARFVAAAPVAGRTCVDPRGHVAKRTFDEVRARGQAAYLRAFRAALVRRFPGADAHGVLAVTGEQLQELQANPLVADPADLQELAEPQP